MPDQGFYKQEKYNIVSNERDEQPEDEQDEQPEDEQDEQPEQPEGEQETPKQEEQDDGEGGAVMQHDNSKVARNLNESEFVFAIWQKFCSCYLTTMSHIFLSL